MPINTDHIVFDKTGKINASLSLRNIFNEFVEKNLKSGMVTKVNFSMIKEDIKTLCLKIKLTHDYSNLNFLSELQLLFPMQIAVVDNSILSNLRLEANPRNPEILLNAKHYSIEKPLTRSRGKAAALRNQDCQQTLELYCSDADSIIKIFQIISYESLATEKNICLSYQVDLLQLLIADSIHQMIVKSGISHHQPDLIEFDSIGRLTAIVVAPNQVRYQLKNTDEVCCFLKQYCHLELPDYFIELLRRQMVLNSQRYANYLESPNEQGIAHIFSQNHLVDIRICHERKQLSALLNRRSNNALTSNPQERLFFQKQLSIELDHDFLLSWKTINNEYRLVLSRAEHLLELSHDHISRLVNVLIKLGLSTQDTLDNIQLGQLLGEANFLSTVIPPFIDDILGCKILFSLPEGTPQITPSGYSYDTVAITQQILNKQEDPTSRRPLQLEQLRPNLLAQRLIAYYSNTDIQSVDLGIEAPGLLIDVKTGEFYNNPVVLPDGETISGDVDSADYPNRCVADLITHFNAELVNVHQPVIRSGIRATIGANIGLLCPGLGVLSQDEAITELEHHIPYVDYHPLSSTLSIHFASKDYARRFELALKRWKIMGELIPFSSSNVLLDIIQTKINLQSFSGQLTQLVFQSTVTIIGQDCIKLLIENLCQLSPAYFDELKKLSGADGLDIFNHLIKEQTLDTWDSYPIYLSDDNEFNKPFSILSMRAQSDKLRMFASSQHHMNAEESKQIETRSSSQSSFSIFNSRTNSISSNHVESEHQVKKTKLNS